MKALKSEKHTHSFLALLLCLCVSSYSLKATASVQTSVSTNEDVSSVVDIIYKVNTYWQKSNPTHGRPFWDRAAYHTGNMAVYRVTKDLSFLDYSLAFAKQNNWKGATSDNKSEWKYSYGESMDYVLFGDWQTCFQVYADLYNIEPDDYKIARAREVMEYQMNTPNTDYWWWVDALYMVMPVMTRLYKITENPLYLKKLHTYWQYTNSIMYDEEQGLYYRDANYIYPQHTTNNGKKDFWSRGNGWAFAAFAQVLTDLPETDQYRDTYIAYYKKMAKKLKESQQEEGYWTRSVIDPDYVPGYETSGSAFFTYGLLWGINNGYLLKEDYGEAARKGWYYLSSIALQENGKVGYVQPIGGSAIPGQYIDINSTADFGVGAFLLAASEMYKYVGGNVSNPLLRISSAELLDATRVKFVFNDVLNKELAENINNYTINGQSFDGVVDFDGERTVTLTLSQTMDYGKYTFAVKNLKSEAGLNISGDTSRTFVLSVPLSPCESGVKVTAVSGMYGNKPENTIDNKLTSRWTCEQMQGWIKYDLGEQKEIFAVDIAFYLGDERLNYFDIELSTDDKNYSPVIIGGISSGLTTELERFSFTPANARYVRILCNGNSVDNSNSFTEVRISYTNPEILNNISLPSKIYTDILLPSGFSWTSSNAAILSPTGLVSLPQEDTSLILTAKNGSQTKDFQLVVASRNAQENNTIIHYSFDDTDKFNENEKTYLRDKSKKQNNARIYGNASVKGILDLTENTQSGFSSNGYLMVPEGLLDSLRSYSVLVKVNPIHLNNLPRAFDFGSTSSNSTFGRLDALSFGMKYNGGTTHHINSIQQIQTNKDTHLAFTFDAKSKEAKIYMDGEVTAEGTISTEPYQLSLIGSNARNYIGRTQWWDTSVAWSNIDFCGTMDDFYVFDVALTKNEILKIQNIGNTGIENMSKGTSFYLYPNPQRCDETIYIDALENLTENHLIEVLNMQGITIFSKQVNSFPATLGSISQSGLYLVKVTNELQQERETFKLIVK